MSLKFAASLAQVRKPFSTWIVCIFSICLLIAIWKWGETAFTVCYLSIAQRGSGHFVPYAQARLHSESAQVRRAAANALGKIGPKAASAVPDLLNTLRNDEPPVAKSAAWALGWIYSPQRTEDQLPTQQVVAALGEALDDTDEGVRRYAAFALSRIGPPAQSTVPRLVSRLSDDHMGYMAARALGEIGAASPDVISQLTALLESSHAGSRAEAALALSRFSPLPAASVSAIARLLNDDDEFVRDAAQQALSGLR